MLEEQTKFEKAVEQPQPEEQSAKKEPVLEEKPVVLGQPVEGGLGFGVKDSFVRDEPVMEKNLVKEI